MAQTRSSQKRTAGGQKVHLTQSRRNNFMRYKPEEILAGGRIQPSTFDCELPRGERSELLRPKRPVILEPPSYRRPVYQPPQRSGNLKWLGAFALSGVILAGVIGHYSASLENRSATAQPAASAVPSTPAPQTPVTEPLVQPGEGVPPSPHESVAPSAPRVAAPYPVAPAPAALAAVPAPSEPGWNPTPPASALIPSEPQRSFAPVPEVKRAELVIKRAELVKLPPPRAKLMSIPLGSWARLTLPDGSQEYALFRGFVSSASMLPLAGMPNDMYIVTDIPAIWVWVPSANGGTGAWVDP